GPVPTLPNGERRFDVPLGALRVVLHPAEQTVVGQRGGPGPIRAAGERQGSLEPSPPFGDQPSKLEIAPGRLRQPEGQLSVRRLLVHDPLPGGAKIRQFVIDAVPAPWPSL